MNEIIELLKTLKSQGVAEISLNLRFNETKSSQESEIPEQPSQPEKPAPAIPSEMLLGEL